MIGINWNMHNKIKHPSAFRKNTGYKLTQEVELELMHGTLRLFQKQNSISNLSKMLLVPTVLSLERGGCSLGQRNSVCVLGTWDIHSQVEEVTCNTVLISRHSSTTQTLTAHPGLLDSSTPGLSTFLLQISGTPFTQCTIFIIHIDLAPVLFLGALCLSAIYSTTFEI